ncbi:MAG: sulfatase-like hydrolase/transferase, partial [Isosphaeraceae bacterium]
LNYFDAHSPFIPPQGHKRMFGMAALPQNERAEIILREFRLKPDTPSDQAEKIRRDAATVRLDSYESCIAYLDGQLGLLFDALDRRGLRENTLVVVTSDHGEHFAERGFFGHGISLYGPEIRVPLLIFPPKSRADIQVGRVVNQPISLRDIAATVADLAEIAPRTAFPGTSLARYCQGNAAPTPLLAELGQRRDIQPNVNVPTSMGPLKALIHDDLVFIRNGNGREELYHLPSDPTETHNLVEVPQLRPAVDQARQKMDALISRTSDRVIR